MRLRWMWLVSILLLAAPSLAQAGGEELALTYNWMRGNAPVGTCGCFALNGGDASLSWKLNPRLALTVEAGATRASSQDLTLATYLAGPRLRLLSPERSTHSRLQPFAQLLAGTAHASGALAGTAGHSSSAFAMRAGGGLDVPLNGFLSLRVVEANYLLARIPNQVNDRQNIVQLGAGLVFRLGRSNGRSRR